MSHKRMIRTLTLFVLLTLLAAALPVALAAPPAQEGGGTEYALTFGWYRGRSTYYYSFDNPIPSSDGGLTVDTAPIYVFQYDDGSPVAGQHNVVDVIPGEAGYSDLWEVHLVTVPDNYVPESVTSYADIVANGYTITPTGTLVNCPIAPEGSTLQYSQQALVQGWHDGAEIYYFDFGPNVSATAPIYVLQYGDGTSVIDQNNIINTTLGDADYTAFWQVHLVTVPDDYTPNSVTSYDEIVAAGYAITETEPLVNCPVVETGPTSVELSGLEGAAATGRWLLPLLLLAMVLVLSAGAALVWVKNP